MNVKQKVRIKIIRWCFIINGKSFYDQPIDYDMKRYEETSWKIGQGEDYTTSCMLDHYYIKKYYRLIALASSRQKELDGDTNAIPQIDFVGQFRKLDADGNATDHGLIYFINFRKNQRREIKIFSRTCTSMIKVDKLSRSKS